MNKPEPLFPPSTHCPDCGKKTRIKWAAPRDVPGEFTGLGSLNCLHCGAHHVRAVGPTDAIETAAQMLAAQYHENCGHDHSHSHGEDPMHGVTVIAGGENFAYIRLPD